MLFLPHIMSLLLVAFFLQICGHSTQLHSHTHSHRMQSTVRATHLFIIIFVIVILSYFIHTCRTKSWIHAQRSSCAVKFYFRFDSDVDNTLDGKIQINDESKKKKKRPNKRGARWALSRTTNATDWLTELQAHSWIPLCLPALIVLLIYSVVGLSNRWFYQYVLPRFWANEKQK